VDAYQVRVENIPTVGQTRYTSGEWNSRSRGKMAMGNVIANVRW
jgi:hypothetical protein